MVVTSLRVTGNPENMVKAGAMAFLSRGIHTCLSFGEKPLVPGHIYVDPRKWPLWLPTTHQSPLTPRTHPSTSKPAVCKQLLRNEGKGK